ncbi:MAG: alcohol dehydrogenase catalytic domain-containing protein [Syntrophorhabdaceae bacterium]|nr:alcohol dehydrogenase catalytic domain-containing protein [Syntrophorhabdaceae bacterium]
MKAIVFDGGLTFTHDRQKPMPVSGEALIRVTMAGICNTDMEIIKGYLGFRGIIGHEFTGIVEAVGGRSRRLIGKRVVGEINCGCRRCDLCLAGLEKHCPRRTTLGILGREGALAEFMTLPVRNLHEIPDGLTDDEAVFAEPLAAAFEILEQIRIRPTDKVLVLGDGKLGILCALALGLTGAKLTLAGKHPSKLGIARDQGVPVVLTKDLPSNSKYDIVVEATGSASGFEIAMEFTRPRGTIVLKSTVAHGAPINLAPLVIDEITVVGSRCGPFKPALKALAEGRIDVKPLISGVFPPEEAKKAFASAKKRDTLKVLVDFRTAGKKSRGQ